MLVVTEDFSLGSIVEQGNRSHLLAHPAEAPGDITGCATLAGQTVFDGNRDSIGQLLAGDRCKFASKQIRLVTLNTEGHSAILPDCLER